MLVIDGGICDMGDIPEFLINRHYGKVCVILGNGPSLNYYNLDDVFFRDNITLGSNAIGYRFIPNYYIITDRDIRLLFYEGVIRANGKSTFLLGSWCVHQWGMLRGVHSICYDFSNRDGVPVYGRLVHGRTTGVVMLHLAYSMGFKYVFMLGVDGYGVNSASSHFYDDRMMGFGRADLESDRLVDRCLRQVYECFRTEGRFLFSLSPISVHNYIIPVWDGVKGG